MTDPLQCGDIVRFMGHHLGIVAHAWDSTMAPASGRLVVVDYVGHKRQPAFGARVGVLDASRVEFMAKGVLPSADTGDLGMEHPSIMARMQAGIDAAMAYRCGFSFRGALAMAGSRADDLFGGAPPGWVATAVARVYASSAHDPKVIIKREQNEL